MANSPFGSTGPRPIDPSLLPWLDLGPLQYRYIPSPPQPNGPAIPYGAPVLSARRPNYAAPQDRSAALFDTDAAIRKALADRAAQAPITGTAMRAGKQSREAFDRGDYLGAIAAAMTGGMTALAEADPRSLGGRGGRNMMGESPAQQAINAQIRLQSPVGRAIGANFGTGVRQYYAADPMRAFGGVAPNSRWGAPTGSYAEVEPSPPRPSWFDRLAARSAGTMFAGVPIPPTGPTPKPAPRPVPEGTQKLPTTGPVSSKPDPNRFGPIGQVNPSAQLPSSIFWNPNTGTRWPGQGFSIPTLPSTPSALSGKPQSEEETEFNSRQAERAFIGSEQHRAMPAKDRLEIFFRYFPHMKAIASSPDKYVGDYVPKYMLDSYGVSELLPTRPVVNQFTPSPELSEPGVGPAKAWRSSANLSAPETAGSFMPTLTAADVTALRSEPPLFTREDLVEGALLTKENLEQWSALERAGALDPERYEKFRATPRHVAPGDVYELDPRTGIASLDFPSGLPAAITAPTKYGYLGAGLPANPAALPTRQVDISPRPQSPLPNPDLMELQEQRANQTANKLDEAFADASPMQRALWTALLRKFEEEAAIGRARPLLKIKKNGLSEASIEELERRDDPSPPKWMEQTHNKSGKAWWGTKAREEAGPFVSALMQALNSPTIELGDGKTGKVLEYEGQSTPVSFDTLREMIENYAVEHWHRTSAPRTVSEIAASIDRDYPNLTPEEKTAMLEARLMRQSERASTEFAAPEYSAQNEDVLKDTRYQADEYAGTQNDKRKLIENAFALGDPINEPASERTGITMLKDRYFFRNKLSDEDWEYIKRHLPTYKGARTNVDPKYYSIPTLTSDKKKPGGIDFVGIDLDAMNAKIDYKTPGFEQRRAAIQGFGAYPKNPAPYRGTQLRDFAFFIDQAKINELVANGRELGKDFSLFDVLQDDLRAALSDGRAINLDDRMTRDDGIAWLKALGAIKQTKAVDAAIAKNRRLIVGTGVRDAIANAFAANDAPSSTGETPGIGRTVAKPAFMMASEIQAILEKGGKSEAVFRYLMQQNAAAGGLPIRTVLDVMNALSSGIEADVSVPLGTALIFGTPKNGVIPEMGVGKADATIFPNQQIKQAVVERDPTENEERAARGEQQLPRTRNVYAPTHRPYVRFRGPKTEEKYTIKPKAEQTQPEQVQQPAQQPSPPAQTAEPTALQQQPPARTITSSKQQQSTTPAQPQPPTTTAQPKPFKVIEYYEDKWTLAGINVMTRSFELTGIPAPIYVFGDNLEGTGRAGQAVIRGHADAYGIPTKRSPKTSKDAYFGNPANEQEEAAAITAAVDRIIDLAQRTGRMVVLPKAGLGTGLAKLEQKSPRLFAHLQSEIARLKAAQGGQQPTQQSAGGGGVVPMTGSKNKRGLTGDFRRPNGERRGPVDEFGRPLRNIRFASRAVKEGRPDLDARVLYRDKPVQADVDAWHGHKVPYSGLPDPEHSRLGMRHAGYGAYFTVVKGVAMSYGEYLKHIRLNPKARFLHLDRPVPNAVLNAAIRRFIHLEEGHEVNPDFIDNSKLDDYQAQKIDELLSAAAIQTAKHTTNLLNKTNARPQSFGFTTDPRHLITDEWVPWDMPITGLGLNLALQELAARGPNGPRDWFDIGHIARDLGYSGQTHVGGTFVGKGAHKVFVYNNQKAASLISESKDTKDAVIKGAAIVKLVTTMTKQSNTHTALRDLFFVNPKSDPPELPKQVKQLIKDFSDDNDVRDYRLLSRFDTKSHDVFKYDALNWVVEFKNAVLANRAGNFDDLVASDIGDARYIQHDYQRNDEHGILANLRHRTAMKYIKDRFYYAIDDITHEKDISKADAAVSRLSKNIGLVLKEKYKVNPSVFEPLLFNWFDSRTYSEGVAEESGPKLNEGFTKYNAYYSRDAELITLHRLLKTGRFSNESAEKIVDDVSATLRSFASFGDAFSINNKLRAIQLWHNSIANKLSDGRYYDRPMPGDFNDVYVDDTDIPF